MCSCGGDKLQMDKISVSMSAWMLTNECQSRFIRA